MHKILRKLNIFIITILTATSFNTNASEVIGNWMGNIVSDGNPMFVFIDIDSLEPNASVFSLTWGEPENCILKATYGGSVEDKEVFYATGSNSSHTPCFKKYVRSKSQIRVNITETGNLHYEIFTKGTSRESAVLKRKGG